MAEVKDPEKNVPAPAEEQKIVYGGEAPAEKAGGFLKRGISKPNKKRRKVIRWIILAVLVIAGIVALVKFLGGGSKAESEVVTNDVTYGSITSTVEGSGLTKPKDSKAITLTTAGVVQEVYVAEGDHVTAGQQLFSVDSPAARTAVRNAQTTVDGYQKQLNALQKDIAGLNLSASYAGKLLETVKLQKGDTISKGDKVATLVDDTRMLLKQYYSYAYKGEIRAGQTATVSLPALMSTVTGKVESVHMVSRITPEGSKLFEADIVVTNPGTLTADMVASATLSAGGETVYPYEAGKLAYYRSGDLKSTVNGTVISSSLVDYMSVSAGQTLVRIDGEDSENEIFTLQQQLDTAQQDLDKAQKNLDNMNAVAPIDGTVIGLSIAPGDELSGTAVTAITIADTTTMLIDATVDERNISYVQSGMSVDITDWSGNTYVGTVENISLTSTVTNGVASYPMSISVDNTEGLVVNGSNVNYSLIASQNDDCLVLPIQCVKYVQMDDGSTATVVFVQGDRPENAIDLPMPPEDIPDGYWAVPVEVGISDDYNVEIKSGVEEGTTVFTAVQTTSSWG
ncbi:MAG: HlyD family efflux transporter periplasmic adaptor subunit [Oscillibacter sp.]|jgi:multidrug efflux pump subunit AcrA (membrane-fusion protein)|nr:HlyD family efflux transporter periplasmic adaptor subunit [Oscillibacter sp.]